MSLHRLHAVQHMPAPLADVWTFFLNPRNLAKITPEWVGLEFTSDLPERMSPGLRMTYRLRPILGIPVTWISEITRIDAPHCFVDEQRAGPYRSWRHEHRFRSTSVNAFTGQIWYHAWHGAFIREKDLK